MIFIDYIFGFYQIKTDIIYTEDLSKPTNQFVIDPNLVNIDGLTILHLLIYNYRESFDPYIKKILPFTDLNYQDNLGNTIVYLLVETGLWKKFKEILELSPMNIYIKNNQMKTPVDMISTNEREGFIDLVVNSYLKYLKTKDTEFLLNWQNKCGFRGLNDMNEPIIKDDVCKKYIKESILEDRLSIPMKKDKQTITIGPDQKVQFTTFTGSLLDTICGFAYLEHKYKNTSSLLNLHSSYDPSLEKYNESLGIGIEADRYLIHFEIKWLFQQLFFPPNFETDIKSIILGSKYKFIIIPIGIILSNGNHSNVLFYDISNNTMERFEPHGSGYPYEFNYNPDLLDELINSKMGSIIDSIDRPEHFNLSPFVYVSPRLYLPKIGFQTFENMEIHFNKNIGDPNGFCTLWCVWYLDYKLKHINIPSRKIIKKLFEQIRLNNLSFRDVIRNYSKKITDLRDHLLSPLNINDYLNNKLGETQQKKLMESVIKFIKS